MPKEIEGTGFTEFERARQVFLNYFDGEKRDSAKCRAYIDHVNHERYVGRWRGGIDSLATINPKDERVTRSRIRIDEFKIASLEIEIDRSKATLPGYAEATEELEDMRKTLWWALDKDEEETGEQSKPILKRFLEVEDEIYQKLIHRKA